MSKAAKAIVLLSGGLDSATTLYWAQRQGYDAHALIFDYGQRHRREVRSALNIARAARVPHELVKIGMPWKGSALLDKAVHVPTGGIVKGRIPATYVPARNIIFVSFAASFAEAIGAQVILIGANAIDYSGYPDCRPGFFKAFQAALDQGLKTGVQKKRVRILTPLIRMSKADIVRLGASLGVPFGKTWSCYNGSLRACNRCDSCRLRAKGFADAGIKDPVL